MTIKNQSGLPESVGRNAKTVDDNSELRHRAEEKLLKQLGSLYKMPPADVESVIQELRLHQIELEMQNDELRRAQMELEASRKKYFDLYDLAPVGYFSLDEKGIIIDANLTAAVLLSQERGSLVGQALANCIFREDQDIYYLCHKRLVETLDPQACEMRMVRKGGAPVWIRLDISSEQDIDGVVRDRAVIVDITARKQAEDESRKAASDLNESHEQLRHLAAHLQAVKEEERTNIALEIHDELGQTLTALKMDLSRIAGKLVKTGENEAIGKQLNAAIDRVSSTIGTVQQICTNLRPTLLDHLGIEAAIEWQAEDFQKSSGVECTVAVADDIFSVDINIANALFRVFQEALTNVLKHSHATKVEATLKENDGKIALEIHDNGVGITEEQMSKRHSFGLLGMRERLYPLGGTISIKGEAQRGTTLTVIIPLPSTAIKK